MDSSLSTIYPDSANTSMESVGGNIGTSQGVRATTISTVVVRNGPLQMVVALLQSGDLFHIKVVEVEPKLTTLGDNIDEAVCLQKEHDELLKQLQDKSTPVEEFVRKADKLLAQRKANPQVLDAMGHSLNIVWEDILKLVHDRKHLLDLCANFHEKMGSCRGKMASLEVACKDTMIPIEIDAVQEFLTKFKQLRIEVLTAVMSALKEGNEILARLQDIAQSGTLDSRPDHIKRDAMRAITQVQQWLENLHDRRNMLEAAWQTRKSQLEQCLALAILAKDLDDLDNTIMNHKNSLYGPFTLGDSEKTASDALTEYQGLKHDANLLRDRALKITRATEKLITSGGFAGDEACSRAYGVLNSSTEYLEIIDEREHWLHQSKDFFIKSHKTLTVLERLEIELSTNKLPTNSPEAFALYEKVLKDLAAFTEEPLRLGYALLDEVGRTKPETQGVKRILDEIENRKIYIEGFCSASSEEKLKLQQALEQFMEEYNEILSWLVSIAEASLRTNNSLGNNKELATIFLNQHHRLMQDLEIRGENINNLLLNIKDFLDSLDTQQRYEVDTKADALHKHWIEIKELVIRRVDLVSLYIEFLEKAEKLSDMFRYLEEKLQQSPEDEKMQQLENSWGEIKTSFGNLKVIGMRFLNTKVADPYLETKSACSSVEEILNSFSNRQFDITSSWEKWTTSITEKRETQIIWERIMNENSEVITRALALNTQIYPILSTTSVDAKSLYDHTKQKLNTVLQDFDKAINELTQRITSTSGLHPKDDETAQKVIQVITNLRSIKEKLENIKYDYKQLSENIIQFIENVITTRQLIDEYFVLTKQPIQQHMPGGSININIDREKVGRDFADHEVFRENVMDKFRSLISQSEKLIERVRVLEPENAREHDTDRILTLMENLRVYFESNNEKKMSELQQVQVITNFDRDFSDIKKNLDNVSKQLNDINGQYGETSSSAKTTSLAFEYYERTIELLEKRIENFIKLSENIYTTNPDAGPHVRSELEKLKKQWEDFRSQVKSTRHSINMTNEYFVLLDKIEVEYREVSSFYSRIVSKIPFIRQPVEASNLINDIERYTSEHEPPQMENINKLYTLAQNTRKQDVTNTITLRTENITLFQSFIKLKSDISVVEDRLRNEEKLKAQKELEDLQKPVLEIKEIKDEVEDLRVQRQQDELQKLMNQVFENKVQSELIKVQHQLPSSSEIQNEFHERKEVVEVCTQIHYSAPIFVRPLKDAIIKEGEKFTFICEVTGNPRPSVEWFKDGIPIQNNLDYHTTYSEGICTLSIEETFTEDSADFMCRATNSIGFAQTESILSVKEHSVDEQMIPPTILKFLQHGNAREGSSFQFSCVVTGNPLPNVTWYKNDKCIDDSPDYIITYNNGEALLKFEEVFLEDHAVYTCKASNPAGSEQCFASLCVEPLEPTEVPRVIVPLSNAMARVGQKIKLECVVTGLPRPEIYWTHNGKPFICRDAKYENDRVTLIIPESYPKDAGVYIVTAKNLAGEAYSSCNVSVKGRLPNETSDSEIASDMEPIKPSVQLPLKDVAIFEGKSVRLDCIIVGQPEPEVIWYHNDRPVKESADVQLLFQGDRCSLVIHEAYLEDAGKYKVVAINSAGEASSQCSLTVTPLNIAEPATRVQSERIMSNESPPKFEKFLTDVLAPEGDTVELECSAIGDPQPTAKWYLSNKELQESDRIKFVQESGGIFKLIIKNVSAEDKGVYTVKASNSSGDAKCFSHLIVKSVNAAPGQQQLEIEEKLICPSFRELFSDRNAHQGDVIKFECIVVGKPTPKVKWLFNDQPVHGKNFLISTSGDRQVLTIPEALPETIGKIACVAENEIGKATCVANLNLLDAGIDVPSTINVQNISQEHNSGSSIVTIKKQMFTSTSTTQLDSTENGIEQTQVNGGSSRIDQALKQFGQQAPAENLLSRQFQEYHKTNETPVTIEHKSTVTVIKPGGETETHHRTTRKSIAPRFISPLIGKIVDQGADIRLEAVYDGYPTPEIKVQKNGEDLVQSDRLIINNQFNKVTIELSNVVIGDAGRYSVTANNPTGTSTSTADVVVKKSIFPPVFGHRLQAQVAKRGERVIMDVEVTGTPDPTVTWFKDNKPLNEALTSEHKIRSIGNSHTLVIEKVKLDDTGKYMVKATNAGGEAQSIADFAVLEPTPERMMEIVKTVVYDDVNAFKDDKPKTQPDSFHTSKLESSSEQDKHGTTESTIITEHRCTTEATMRLEHKPAFLDLPVLRMPTKPTATSLLDQISVSTNTDQNQTKTDATQTHPPLPHKPESAGVDNSGIESSSISKKSAFQYFKQFQRQVSSGDEKYTKFEDIHKIPPSPPQITSAPPVPQQKAPAVGPSLEELNLVPGSPPQIGFIPKPGLLQQREHIFDKIKKLEQSQKVGIEPPAGGISTLPQISSHQKKEFSSSFSSSREMKFESSSGPIYRPQAILAAPMTSFTDGTLSPKPSAEGVAMEKLWASPKPFEHEPIYKESRQESYFSSKILTSDSEPDYPLPEEPRRQSIKDTAKLFEDKIKEHEEKPPVIAPKPQVDLKAPFLIKQMFAPKTPEKPVTPQENFMDIHLEPGTPPEICFAPKFVPERKPSLVETLGESLQREPSKVLPFSVRTMPPAPTTAPPPLPPKDFQSSAPPIPSKPPTFAERTLPFTQPPELPKTPKPAPPATPPKCLKNDFYECKTSTDESIYRHVQGPQIFSPRPQSTETTPILPRKFDIAPPPPAPPLIQSNLSPSFGTTMQQQQQTVRDYSARTEGSLFHKYESHSMHESKKSYETSSTSSTQQQTKDFYPHVNQQNQIRKTKMCRDSSSQTDPQSFKTSTTSLNTAMSKNISMKTRDVKVTQEPQLEPFPFKPEPSVLAKTIKVPPPPSPSKFVKGEFRESDYSEFDERIQPIWKPYDSETELKGYRPIKPVLTPTLGRRSNLSDTSGRSPIPPVHFDTPPKFDGPPRPKFEPIVHEIPIKVQSQNHVFKPKPVSAQQPCVTHTSPKQPSYTTQYYTAVAGPPVHLASHATETRNSMQMKESSESCHRVVNMSQTKRIIHFDKQQKSSHETYLEPFPYAPSPSSNMSSPKPRITFPVTPTPTPTKFTPGKFGESDYESEFENARIRPVWTPNPFDEGEPRYRRVNPPRPTRSSSLPRSYDRVLTPMEFDRSPPEMPSKILIETPASYYTMPSQQSKTYNNYSSSSQHHTVRTTRDDMNLNIGSPPKPSYLAHPQVKPTYNTVKDFSSTIQKKTSQFINDISNDMKTKTTTHNFRPGFKRAPSEGDNRPQAYRDESRVSQYGTKHIDPDTGLIYFKYDFGYEFGILFPGQGRKLIGGTGTLNNKNNQLMNENVTGKHWPRRVISGEIQIPVHHERTTPKLNGFASDSEFSEPEYDGHAKKRYSLPSVINVDELHNDNKNFTRNYSVNELPTTVPVNVSLREERPKRAPLFITPLKDIAVVIGQPARFECIVQCDPHPQIAWAKNGFPLQQSNKHVIEFRNGVCRLTIPQTFPDDAGNYSCTGYNQVGTTTTEAELLVPANRCGVRF